MVRTYLKDAPAASVESAVAKIASAVIVDHPRLDVWAFESGTDGGSKPRAEFEFQGIREAEVDISNAGTQEHWHIRIETVGETALTGILEGGAADGSAGGK